MLVPVLAPKGDISLTIFESPYDCDCFSFASYVDYVVKRVISGSLAVYVQFGVVSVFLLT